MPKSENYEIIECCFLALMLPLLMIMTIAVLLVFLIWMTNSVQRHMNGVLIFKPLNKTLFVMTDILPIQKYVSILTIGLLFILPACSDNSTGPDGNGLGEVNLTVSGDVEAQRTGQADFRELEAASMYTWDLEFHDRNPQTFSLSIGLLSHEPIEQPGTGTFEIGFEPANPFEEQGAPVFLASYTHIENEDFANPKEFESGILCPDEFPRGGEITITSSTSNEVSGTFQFSAVSVDFDDSGNCVNNGTINVTGEFTATPRIGA